MKKTCQKKYEILKGYLALFEESLILSKKFAVIKVLALFTK